MRTRVLILGLLLTTGAASSAAAQAQPATPQVSGGLVQTPPATGTDERPTFEVGLGYQLLRAGELCFDDDDDDCASSQTFPLGFAIDGVRNFGALGLVGELGWSRDSEDVLDGLDEASFSQNIFHYAAGVRVTGHNSGTVWPYGQILIGGATLRSSVDFDDDQVDEAFGESGSTTKFMIQPGIGATFVGGDGWGVFGQVDYRRIFLDEDEDGSSGRNDFRVYLGLRFILD